MIRSFRLVRGRSIPAFLRCGAFFGEQVTAVVDGNPQGIPKPSQSPTASTVRHRHHLAGAAAASSSSTLPFPQSMLQQQQQEILQKKKQWQSRTVFIQTESTPNPESLKFVPTNLMVLDSEDGNGYFVQKTDAQEDILKSPLASILFKIDGVKAVYLGADFVTVTKFAEHKWQLMRPEIFSTLMDFFEKPDFQALLDKPLITDTTILDDDDEIVAMIKELIEDRIRPAVQEDGGDIRYKNFEEDTGIVTVQLAGSCVGCPSSSVTLKNGVENMLMHYIPEVTAVVSLDEEEEEGDDEGGMALEEVQDDKKQKTYEERLQQAGIPFSD